MPHTTRTDHVISPAAYGFAIASLQLRFADNLIYLTSDDPLINRLRPFNGAFADRIRSLPWSFATLSTTSPGDPPIPSTRDTITLPAPRRILLDCFVGASPNYTPQASATRRLITTRPLLSGILQATSALPHDVSPTQSLAPRQRLQWLIRSIHPAVRARASSTSITVLDDAQALFFLAAIRRNLCSFQIHCALTAASS